MSKHCFSLPVACNAYTSPPACILARMRACALAHNQSLALSFFRSRCERRRRGHAWRGTPIRRRGHAWRITPIPPTAAPTGHGKESCARLVSAAPPTPTNATFSGIATGRGAASDAGPFEGRGPTDLPDDVQAGVAATAKIELYLPGRSHSLLWAFFRRIGSAAV